jgi:hypothetical protein
VLLFAAFVVRGLAKDGAGVGRLTRADAAHRRGG